MKFFRVLLLPFSLVYGLGVSLRNLAYNTGIFKTHHLPVPVISVGNISTGGTGKTPMAEFLLRYYQQHGLRPAYLSRGYGRVTKGFLKVTAASIDARLFGDEALQVATKFQGLPVAVCENRVTGVRQLIKEDQPDLVILDDAFQHRRIHRDLNLLMVDAGRLPQKDLLLPAGRLREPLWAFSRVDHFVLNKVHSPARQKRAQHFFRNQEAAFARPAFQTVLPFFSDSPQDSNSDSPSSGSANSASSGPESPGSSSPSSGSASSASSGPESPGSSSPSSGSANSASSGPESPGSDSPSSGSANSASSGPESPGSSSPSSGSASSASSGPESPGSSSPSSGSANSASSASSDSNAAGYEARPAFKPDALARSGLILFSGLGNNQFFRQQVEQQGATVYKHFTFRDHQQYQSSDLEKISAAFKGLQDISGNFSRILVLTSEKDFYRLKTMPWISTYSRLPLYYVTIELEWVSGLRALTQKLDQIPKKSEHYD